MLPFESIHGVEVCTFLPSVLWCCWLGLLTGKTHYRVGEPTAAWQFVDIHPHRSFDNGWQYVSCKQWQPPLSGAPVNKMAVNYHEGEIDPSGFRVWLNSSYLRDIFVPQYRQLPDGLVMTTTVTKRSARESKDLRKLFSKYSNVCDHSVMSASTSQTDGQTDDLPWQCHALHTIARWEPLPCLLYSCHTPTIFTV